ncbi:hypothetical protein FRC04_011631 [Tulasnella sp. 424]|nr:hypothetical protein FRC04_011631 [Tulasnella sp. 424]KAG8971449.1 hypothetical protein FRC05_011022 [Tulasnella sp. 425]
MGFWRKFGKVIVDKAQEELNKPEDDDPQQAPKPPAPPHSAPPGAPSFPSAQPYGAAAYDNLPSQFSNLNVGGGASGASTPGYAYNNNSSYGASCSVLVGRAYYAGSARPPVRRCTTGNPASSPPPASIPPVLTPGNSADLRYGGQPSQNVDYLPPLKNPLPRPPQFSNIPIPEPWDPYQRYYGSNTPQGGDNLMPPMGTPGGFAPAGSAYPYGSQSAASSPGPGPTIPSPSPAPGYGRASSQPPPSAASQSAPVDGQCAGVTKKGVRCTRKVKTPPALGFINPEDEVPRYCHQHSKELLGVSGFYSPKGWVDFEDWIPKYLHPDTQTILRAEMEKPISTADVPGYIYCYELRDTEHEEIVHLKVGRAVNLVKRIDEWTKTCESKEPILRGWYPGPDTEEAGRVSMMKGVVTAGRKGLIHLELADLVINKPYLADDFSKGQVKGTGAAPSEHKTKPTSKKAAGDDTPTSTPKRKTRAAAGASASAKKKKAKASADDDDDDDDDDDNDDEFDDSSSGSNGSNGSTGSGGKKGKAKSPKMVVRKPCKDCGQVHKEIFTFIRPTSGPYKNKEWERIVQPVMERWGTFIDYHT